MGLPPKERYGIEARLDVYLPNMSPFAEGRTGIVGWLEKHAEEEESLTPRDFLPMADQFLRKSGMNHVSAINLGDYNVVVSSNEALDNWNDAFGTALNSEQASDTASEAWIVAHGITLGVDLQQEVTFRPRHTIAQSAISVVIRGLPAEWAQQTDEDYESWSRRLKGILKDKAAVAQEEERSRQWIEKYVEDYERLLGGFFTIEKTTKKFEIDLSEVDSGPALI